MLQTVLAIVGVGALFAAFSNDLFGAAVLSFVIASGAATGKLAFDSLVQRAAPDANYGRSFARFEARFQGAWVIGAFVPAVIPLNLVVGGFGVAAAAIFALVSYLIGKPAHEAVPWSSIRTLRPKGAEETTPLQPPRSTIRRPGRHRRLLATPSPTPPNSRLRICGESARGPRRHGGLRLRVGQRRADHLVGRWGRSRPDW